LSTEAVVHSRAVPGRTAYRPVNRTIEHFFFSGMALLLCVIVFIGFAPTYFRAGMVRAPLAAPILHFHGAAFSLWMVLYFVQTALISARRVAWHRSLGTIAFCLPPIMVVLGVIASINALGRGVQIGPLSPETSMAISLIGILWFPVVIFASWRARRRPDAHKRLILIATINLVPAAFGRIPIGVPPALRANGGMLLMLLMLVAYDLYSLHRVHRSTMWAAPLTFASLALAVPIGMTPAWHAFADFLLSHVAPHL
jgi:hypothetical protein